MRLDYVTIFPDYLRPLSLSLPGRAVAAGLLELHVHDLRSWTHDRHRTVDDTPFGGGPGMVMRAEPWGEALDDLGLSGVGTTLVVPSPAGQQFTQETARELATRERLVFACGRYEGIDQRVIDHATDRVETRELSLGDYVLNGGEAAALAMTEAVVRLIPGVLGNAASLREESHEDGLLEHPVYTRPQSWRGHEVPPVLLSGDHGAVGRWREDQARRRTARRRPDLLHASRVLDGWQILPAVAADAGELLTLQRACWAQEAVAIGSLDLIPALRETLPEVSAGLRAWATYVVRSAGRLVGSVRGRLTGSTWDVERLMVAPDLQGHGLGRALLAHAEAVAPASATSFSLVTGASSACDVARYRRAGYRPRHDPAAPPGVVVLTKPRPR